MPFARGGVVTGATKMMQLTVTDLTVVWARTAAITFQTAGVLYTHRRASAQCWRTVPGGQCPTVAAPWKQQSLHWTTISRREIESSAQPATPEYYTGRLRRCGRQRTGQSRCIDTDGQTTVTTDGRRGNDKHNNNTPAAIALRRPLCLPSTALAASVSSCCSRAATHSCCCCCNLELTDCCLAATRLQCYLRQSSTRLPRAHKI